MSISITASPPKVSRTRKFGKVSETVDFRLIGRGVPIGYIQMMGIVRGREHRPDIEGAGKICVGRLRGMG